MNRISRFYRISAPAPAREMDEAARDKYYRRLRMQAFIAARSVTASTTSAGRAST